MFEKKTVFVVGAGASVELGLPTGDQLMGTIVRSLGFVLSEAEDGPEESEILNALRFASHGNPGPRMPRAEYWVAAKAIAEAMPLSPSIDNFMHTHSHDSYINEVGKIAIAYSILEAEQNSRTYIQPPFIGRINFAMLETNKQRPWHVSLVKMLISGIRKDSDLDRLFENVAFIIFNYDRCVEHFLYHALQNYLRISPNEAADLIKKLTIIHPYGQVGFLEWQDARRHNFPYGVRLAPHMLVDVSNYLRTFTEGVGEDGEAGKMQALIRNSERLVFLGFAYAPLNMEILTLPEQSKKKTVVGTAFKISNQNQDVIAEDVFKSLKINREHSHRFELANQSCSEFFNDYERVLCP